MGYTHYWRHHEIPADAWAKTKADAEKLIAASPCVLRLDDEDPGTRPEITDETIAFNGADDDGHETFVLDRIGEGFAFCKTAQKPYDLVVCAILARAKHHAAGHLSVTSDGQERDWAEALAWASNVLGERVAFPVIKMN